MKNFLYAISFLVKRNFFFFPRFHPSSSEESVEDLKKGKKNFLTLLVAIRRFVLQHNGQINTAFISCGKHKRQFVPAHRNSFTRTPIRYNVAPEFIRRIAAIQIRSRMTCQQTRRKEIRVESR